MSIYISLGSTASFPSSICSFITDYIVFYYIRFNKCNLCWNEVLDKALYIDKFLSFDVALIQLSFHTNI